MSVGLVAVCLGLAGCSLFGKKKDAAGPAKPFLSSPPAPAAPGGAEVSQADPSAPLPGANGLLAGQVLDRLNRHPSKVYIQVVDLQDPKAQPSARLEVESQQDGYFVVQGLKLGHHYRLIARAKDGEKVLSGTTLATPPNPRLSIYLSEELVGGDTPSIPDPPTPPGSRSSAGDGAALDPPVKPKPGETLPKNDIPAPSNPTGQMWAPNPGPPASTTAPAVAPDRMANRDDGSTGGWERSPPASFGPGQGPAGLLPPAPQPWNSTPSNQTPLPGAVAPAIPPATPETSPPSGVHLPAVGTPVPSCVVVGRRVENFALNDLNLEPWEYKRHHRGKVVLLDFWRSGCAPCLEAMGHLVKLQQTYQSYGLEIIGIAYVQGTPADQVVKVRAVRARYGVTCTTLLGAGMSCPVKTQLQVSVFPTLVLLGEGGQIIWHSGDRGIGDEYTRREMETEIRRHLGIR